MAKSKEELRLAKREYDRKRREALKNDPKKLEELKEKEKLKYQRKKVKKQVKLVSEMSSREHRMKKKQWLKNSKNYRDNLKAKSDLEERLRENSPPLSDQENDNDEQAPSVENSTCRKAAGRKRIRRDRAKLFRENSKLKSKLKKAESRAEKYKKRYQVLNKKVNTKPPLTPNSKVNHILSGEKVSKEIKRKLLYGEVLNEELSSSYKQLRSSQQGRKLYHSVIKGKILKKYRLLSAANNQILSSKSVAASGSDEVETTGKQGITVRCAKRGKYISDYKKECVQIFFEKDENSRLCPGKRDCLTKNNVKKQKRLLNDSLKLLYDKFSKEVNFKLSYASFCSLKPFWVVHPRVEERDTCACILHTNTAILVHKLSELKVFDHKKPSDVVKYLCCDESATSCLHRKCETCKNRVVQYTIDDPDQDVKIKKWLNEVNWIEIKGTKKKVTKPIKKDFVINIKLLVAEFEEVFPKYLLHVGNIRHQYKEFTKLKENLNETSAVVHIDFSENYSCKYSEEIQAVHFGGGREQITLHTGVCYLKLGSENSVLSFCSLSKSLRHDALSIWAHLKPVFEWIFQLNPNLQTIHVQSDGVVTQYRNKTMFYFISNNLQKLFPKISYLTWNYSEAGHGKGAPDGIGGTLKRTADRIVAQGKDVECFNSLFDVLKQNCQGVKLFEIKEEDINFIEGLGKASDDMKAFEGTLKVHQVIFNSENLKLSFRSLSCFQCKTKCAHYHMGEGFPRPRKSTPTEKFANEPCMSGLTSQGFPRPRKSTPTEKFANKPCMSGLTSHTLKGEKERIRYSEVYSSDEDEGPGHSNKNGIKLGRFVLVRFQLKVEDKKKMKKQNIQQFLGITEDHEENNEMKVMFLKSADKSKTLFCVDDNDVSFVSTKQIVAVLETPEIISKGCRFFYKFKHQIPVV